MSNLYDSSAAHWDYIYNVIETNTQNGGRIPNVLDVRKSSDLWTQLQPAIGIQLIESVPEYTQTSKNLVKHSFLIKLAVKSTVATAGTSPPNLDDANLQTRAILSDGAGNGLIAVLTDSTMQTLGGMASLARIMRIDWNPIVKNANDPSEECWVEVYIIFETQEFVSM